MANFVFLCQVKVWCALLSCEYFFNQLKLVDYLDNILERVVGILDENSQNYIDDGDIAIVQYKEIFEKLLSITASKEVIRIKIYNLKGLNSNNTNIELYDGIIIKLKVAIDKESLYNIPATNGEFLVWNISFYKSDTIFNINSIKLFLTDLSITIPTENNDIVLTFISELVKYNINTIFFIGAQCSSEIKSIITSCNIICIEWLSWKNFEVYKNK
jgi:hypothetical protein